MYYIDITYWNSDVFNGSLHNTNGSGVINLINLIGVFENSEEWTKHDSEQLIRI